MTHRAQPRIHEQQIQKHQLVVASLDTAQICSPQLPTLEPLKILRCKLSNYRIRKRFLSRGFYKTLIHNSAFTFFKWDFQHIRRAKTRLWFVESAKVK
jgi:hypothetical protein